MTAPVGPASPETRGSVAADPRRSSFPSSTDSRPRPAIADLHAYINGGLAPAARECPEATRRMAVSLEAAVAALHDEGSPAFASLADRLVTDASLRREAERDQNVYLGAPFTAWLTHARPDLVFLPQSGPEVEVAFVWARERGVPVTIRGAASGALGGAVPNDGGLVLDLSRLDHIDVNPDDDVCVIGGGARFREIHHRLAEHGLALPVYSSNLGGTFAGWLVSGASGLNGFGPGDAVDVVRAADVVLPDGDLVRFHSDGRLDVPAEAPRRGHREVGRRQPPRPGSAAAASSPSASPIWSAARARWAPSCSSSWPSAGGRRSAPSSCPSPRSTTPSPPSSGCASGPVAACRGRPTSSSSSAPSCDHVRRVWADEDVRAWRRRPSTLSGGEGMPWERLAGPRELGAPLAAGDDGAVRLPLHGLPQPRGGTGPGAPVSARCPERRARLPTTACASLPSASVPSRPSASARACSPPRSACRRRASART